jgi:hypothetical protein
VVFVSGKGDSRERERERFGLLFRGCMVEWSLCLEERCVCFNLNWSMENL